MPTHFLNSKLVSEAELTIPVRDLGFTRGFAVFDFLITYPKRRPFLLSRHIDRLFNSAALINLSIPWSKEQIQKWAIETLAANTDEHEKSIRIVISGGVSDSLLPNPTNTSIAILIDDRHELPKEYYKNGVNIMTVKHTRFVPGAKTNNYIEAVKHAPAAKEQNAVETVYYDDTAAGADQILEGATSNIFAVIGGKLLTPKTNVLPGITRDILLEILKLNIPVETADFSLEQLLAADEVFITASNKEVLPVTKINGKPAGKGVVGPITKEVMRQFQEFTTSEKWA